MHQGALLTVGAGEAPRLVADAVAVHDDEAGLERVDFACQMAGWATTEGGGTSFGRRR
jgi:hypothetical protein